MKKKEMTSSSSCLGCEHVSLLTIFFFEFRQVCKIFIYLILH